MRVLLINDASNNGHLGCFAVANGLRNLLSERRGTQVYPIFNRQLERDGCLSRFVESQMASFSSLLEWCDLVVINGEGTLHHGRAPELEVAMQCAIEAGRPFFVVNSIFEDYPRLVPLLKQAAGISLRDTLSLKEAGDNGISAEPCCDAAIFAAFDPVCGPAEKLGTATTDWHGRAPAITHAEMSKSLNGRRTAFLPFKSPTAAQEWPQIINQIARYGRIVSGRYHATLFSIMAGTPVTAFPSNSHKVAALAGEFGMTEHRHGEGSDRSYSLEGQELEAAQRLLIEKRSSPQLDPLRVLELHSRSRSAGSRQADYPVGSSLFVNRSFSECETARLLADELKLRNLPLPRKQRRNLMQRLDVSTATLRHVAAFLLQEGCAEHNNYVKDALLAAGDEHSASEVTLHSFQARPRSTALRLSLAAMLARRKDFCAAYAIFKSLDEEKPLAGRLAKLAARSANRVGDYSMASRYLSAVLDESKPESLVRAAAVASRAGHTGKAIELASRACNESEQLSEWPARNAGIIVAANGLLSRGFGCMASAIRRYDSTLARLDARCRNDGRETVVYVPASIGVGSAMLALTLMASRIATLPAPLHLIIDGRLISSARTLLGPHISCTGTDEVADFEPSGRVETVFDTLKALADDETMPKWRGALIPDEKRTELLWAGLRRRFPDKTLCGLTWFTPNARTGSGRNISLGDLRAFVSAFPDIQFVSLQPDNRTADFDLQQVAARNIHIEATVDPLSDIDGQLCLISSLDMVVGIDSSAMHFAGAVGKTGAVLLTGEPTWQWPLRSSLYESMATAGNLVELGKLLVRAHDARSSNADP